MARKDSYENVGMESSDILEKFIYLSQKLDKMEYTTSDLIEKFNNCRNVDKKECKTCLDKKISDESSRNNDWIKIIITIIILSILTSGALWYSMTSRMSNLEALSLKEIDVVNKFVTKEQELKSNIDAIKNHEERFHAIKPNKEKDVK